jgi:tetratricopeptide (TPR) repeat protein
MSKYLSPINLQYIRPLQTIFAIIFLTALISSCNKAQINEQFQNIEKGQINPAGILISYPGDGTIFPPEIPSPGISWTDTLKTKTKWHISLSTPDGKELCRNITESPSWRPDSSLWQKIKNISGTDPVSVTIIGEHKSFPGTKFSSGRVSFSFSKDSVGASVFYRAVPLPFSYAVKNVQQIEWYLGSINGGKPRRILDNIPVCANCHSFSDNGFLAMDVDYANDKGSYIIAPVSDSIHLLMDKIITWTDYKKEDGVITYGLLSQISPNGKYVLSTVKDRSVFVAVDNLEYSQLFFPIKGIIAVYDRATKKFYELPGASDKKYVQSNPNWSPDNSEIMFTRANRYISSKIDNSEGVLLNIEDAKEFTTKQKDFKFDLFRLKFNNGTGGKATAIEGASDNGKSNFFARYSPDGKWVVFCQSENFMLLQPDSKLYIMPASGGTPRLMNCNTKNMNSWHSWSPDSRWLVFSSKSRGPYTQLYLTHIDENGNDSPPVFLENMAFETKASNIPEFFNNKGYNLSKMIDDFSKNALYYTRTATLNIKAKEYRDAIANIDKALEADSTYFSAYEKRFILNIILGESRSKADLHDKSNAKKLIEAQIKQTPGDKSLLLKRGKLRLLMEDYEGALQDGLEVLKTNSDNYNAYDLITVTYQNMGQWNKTIPYFKKMRELQPENTQLIYNLANSYQNSNQIEPALSLLNELIDKNPNTGNYYISRAGLLMAKGEKPAAKADYDKAVSVDPNNFRGYQERGLFLISASAFDLGKSDFEKAISLLGEEIRKNPQDASLLIKRAEIMEQAGNFQGAQLEYENYLRLWPLNYTVLGKEAIYFRMLKKWQEAADMYTVIIDNFPGDAGMLYNRSLTLQEQGNFQKALDDINYAIHLDPLKYMYFLHRSRVRYQLGDKAGFKNDLNASSGLLNEQRKKGKLSDKEIEIMATIERLKNDTSNSQTIY